MKKRITLLVIAISLIATSFAFAYHSGFCLKAGCNCHQYQGGDGGWDRCTNCGHYKVDHS
jgi:hypothetical protein